MTSATIKLFIPRGDAKSLRIAEISNWTGKAVAAQRGGVLYCRMKGAEGRGQRTPNGFVVFSASTAVLEERPSMEKYPYVMAQRKQLIAEGALTEKEGFLVFTKDTEFSSPPVGPLCQVPQTGNTSLSSLKPLLNTRNRQSRQ
jgi:predicted RNA-binding protein with TRAM domain